MNNLPKVVTQLRPGGIGSDRTFVTVRCPLRTVWPVIRPTKTRRSCLLKPRANLVSLVSGGCVMKFGTKIFLIQVCAKTFYFVTSSVINSKL